MSARSIERNQFLCDVFITAIEGGINYWAEVESYGWYGRMTDGSFYAWVVEFEKDDAEAVRVDIDVIARGFARLPAWLLRQGFAKDHYFWQAIEANRSNGEDGDFDSSVADIIVQLGLLGEVRY